ncbi:MAG: 2-iminobutanoate/2-iminopropanoate deaminase [Actinomycetota bacterium]|jgi:reactive intermediate/imine deaminase|nr:2-iminobutanoate/2-iminopropanoate deaminase [Actinomycetota bacterium]
MIKMCTNPDTVSPPRAAYSQAVRVEMGERALVYVAGQVPIDADGNLVGGTDMAGQTEQVWRNIARILEANGASLADVVQTITYVTDIDRLDEVNAVRARTFAADPPTSTAVAVTALAQPEWLVEIQAVAVV